jgi:hypothetical protein
VEKAPDWIPHKEQTGFEYLGNYNADPIVKTDSSGNNYTTYHALQSDY